MAPVSMKELELSKTYVWSQSNKEEDYSTRMGLIYAKLLCSYESCGDVEVFDQNKILINDLWQKEKHNISKNEFLYRIEKILMLYEHWFKTNKWLTPLVAIEEGNRYRIHPGRDRWFIMNHLKVPRYHFLVVSQINYQVLDQVVGFWTDPKRLSIKGEEKPAIFHDYDKTDVYKFARTADWLTSNMLFKQFARSTQRQRSTSMLINKKGP